MKTNMNKQLENKFK